MRPRRPEFTTGSYYHIYNRGAHGVSIFREPDNYHFAIKKIKRYCRELQVSMIAYCLMPNHYHFLIRQDGDLQAGMLPQRVFNSYTKAYNRRYDHSGTIFEGPYKVLQVDNQPYLLHLCRYIHANPVKDGLVDDIDSWDYSNYPEWIGTRPGTLVNPAFVATNFPAPGDYTAYVEDYLQTRNLPDNLKDDLADWGVE